MVSEEKILEVFPIISLWELMTPGDVASLDPRGMVCRIYVGDHNIASYILLNLLALGLKVSEKKIFEGSLTIKLYINI